jgi:glycosyltransferase involved in cell wall biosynthesis
MIEQLSVLILTRDEAPNIGRSLRALSLFRHFLLVDSFSRDDTVKIAVETRPDVQILQREFDLFAIQCNFGLSNIQTEWVLSLDADYILSDELSAEISELNPPPDVAGYSVDFVYSIYGRPLRSSAYPPRTVLYRRDKAHYVDEGHGHRVVIQGKVEKLTGRIFHDDRKPLSHWILSQDRYATLEARHLLSKPFKELNFQDRLRRRIVFAAPVMFLYLFFVRGLILDGWPGWFYVAQRTFAELLLSIRLLIEKHGLEERAES